MLCYIFVTLFKAVFKRSDGLYVSPWVYTSEQFMQFLGFYAVRLYTRIYNVYDYPVLYMFYASAHGMKSSFLQLPPMGMGLYCHSYKHCNI